MAKATFAAKELLNNEVRVTGTDVDGVTGVTVLDSTQWNEIKAHADWHLAEQGFNDVVEAHFADITAAAEKFNEAVAPKPLDPIEYFEVHEGVEAVQGVERVAHKLNRDSIILRLIEDGQFDRLVWVNDQLVVAAA